MAIGESIAYAHFEVSGVGFLEGFIPDAVRDKIAVKGESASLHLAEPCTSLRLPCPVFAPKLAVKTPARCTSSGEPSASTPEDLTILRSPLSSYNMADYESVLPLTTPMCPSWYKDALEKNNWDVDVFRPLEVLATGSISKVVRVELRAEHVSSENGQGNVMLPGTTAVLKVYEKKRMRTLHDEQVKREIFLHRDLSSSPNRHVVPLYAVFEDDKSIYLLQKFVVGGDLYRELKRGMYYRLTGKEDLQLKWAQKRGEKNCLYGNEKRCAVEIVRPLLKTLVALHARGIVHRDIKPENLLLSRWDDSEEEDIQWHVEEYAEVSMELTEPGTPTKRDSTFNLPCDTSVFHDQSRQSRKIWPSFTCANVGDRAKKHRKRRGFKVQLCDFGLAVDSRVTELVTRVGTVDYMAPEVVVSPSESELRALKEGAGRNSAPRYDSSVDVWAVGVLLYELLVGRPPFGSQLHSQSMTEAQILNGKVEFVSRIMTSQAKSFILTALTYNNKDRPTAAELLEHPWIVKHCGRPKNKSVSKGPISSTAWLSI